MDGLIPMVFKSLRRSQTRRQYKYLSSPAPATHAYNIADFYITENDHHGYLSNKYDHDQHVNKPGADRVSGLRVTHHRRSNSVHVGASRGFGWEEESEVAAPAKAKQLVRFRSNKMFSCVTGA